MVVIGVDQSLCGTGVVVMDGTQILYSGVIETDTDYGDVYIRIRFICFEVIQIIKKYGVERMVIEGLAFAANGRVADLAGVHHGIVLTSSIATLVVEPKTLKKTVTGSGNATKIDMFNALPITIQKRFEKQFPKSAKGKMHKRVFDLADAYWLSLAS